MGVPQLLPQSWDILLNLQGEAHPLVIQGYLKVAARQISGCPSAQEDFLNRLKNSTVLPGERSYDSAWRG